MFAARFHLLLILRLGLLLVLVVLPLLIGSSFSGSTSAQERGAEVEESVPKASKGSQERLENAPAGKQQPQMHCPMMAGLKGVDLFADSPAVLLAQAQKLELNDGQVKQLQEIEKAARKKAQEVLTGKQQEQIREASEGPLSMMQLSRMRMAGKQRGGMMCPMCMKMMQQMKEKDEGAARE